MPENLWIEVGVLCKTMKEKRNIIETLKQHFNINVKSVGRNSKRRWLEATVFMEDMTEEEAVNKVSKLLEGTEADGWLDVWTHAFSHHVTSAKSVEAQQKAAKFISNRLARGEK